MTGNKLIDNVLLGITLLCTLAAFGTYVYTEMVYVKPLPNDKDEKEKLLADSKKVVLPGAFKVDPLIINLKSNNSRLRFLDVQTHLVLFRPEDQELLETSRPLIHDTIIDLVGTMQPDELNTVAGKVLVESRLKNALNEKLQKNAIQKIYFSKFVVQ